MSADDPGLAARLRRWGLLHHDIGDIATARALDLERYLKAALIRLNSGGPVVLTEEDLELADGFDLGDKPDEIHGRAAVKLQLKRIEGAT